MLKKLAIFSAILLLLSMIGFAILLPIAVSSMADSVANMHTQYIVLNEVASQSAQGIEKVRLEGYYPNFIEVRPSQDNNIRVLTNKYHFEAFQVQMSPLHANVLEIQIDGEGAGGFKIFSRQNIQMMLSGSLNGSKIGSFVVEIPEEVTLDLTSGSFLPHGISIDSRVKVDTPGW